MNGDRRTGASELLCERVPLAVCEEIRILALTSMARVIMVKQVIEKRRARGLTRQ